MRHTLDTLAYLSVYIVPSSNPSYTALVPHSYSHNLLLHVRPL